LSKFGCKSFSARSEIQTLFSPEVTWNIFEMAQFI